MNSFPTSLFKHLFMNINLFKTLLVVPNLVHAAAGEERSLEFLKYLIQVLEERSSTKNSSKY